MTDKAYIVANEQQEMTVLRELEKQGDLWLDEFDKPTVFIPSLEFGGDMVDFPYVIFEYGHSNLVSMSYVDYDNLENFGFSNAEIAFDGRKEKYMSEEYTVSQEFMNELRDWKKRGNTEAFFVGSYDISMLPDDIKRWWNYPEINNFECNSRLIAILRWVNGEDVFEVEKPKKWVVRSKERNWNDTYYYGLLANHSSVYQLETIPGDFGRATKFDTKEEAESWANFHQEVIEVEG